MKKMKKIVLYCLVFILFTACQTEKKTIEFKKLVNLELGNLQKENATLRATAVFMNISKEEFHLKDLVLDFSIDGKDVGTIVSKSDKVIQPNSEFSIPIKYSYETKAFILENHEPATTYAIQLLGDLTLKNAKGEDVATKVKYAETYEYLTKKEERVEKREDRKEERKRKREERKNKQD
jgi:hypothetical protein